MSVRKQLAYQHVNMHSENSQAGHAMMLTTYESLAVIKEYLFDEADNLHHHDQSL
jgi:hypothetical protein